MTKKNQQLLTYALFIVGAYLIYKRLSQGKSGLFVSPATSVPSLVSYKNYTVTTSSGNLNVRSRPNTSSSVVTQLKKGENFLGYPSPESSDWIAVIDASSTPPSVIGYVSATFAKLS